MASSLVTGPDSSALKRDQFASTVVENVNLCREHYRLVLRCEAFPATRPGQFVQVACRDTGENYNPESEFEWDEGQPLAPAGAELMQPLAFLRRPFSLAGRRDTANGVELDLIQRIVGVGTDWMSRLKPGDIVDVLGPLGNAFRLPGENEEALMVGNSLAEDVAGAQAVGIRAAWRRSAPDAEGVTADVTFDELSELLALPELQRTP